MSVIGEYLNLRSDVGRARKAQPVESRVGKDSGQHKLGVWVQYVAIVLGILVQKYWSLFRERGVWSFEGLAGWALFALITALLIFPAVYKNSLDPDQPVLVQFCLVFTAGMGWQAIVANILPK